MTSAVGPREEKKELANQGVFDTKTVVKTLESLMNQVTTEKVTPDTVNAACNCADRIVDILRLHLDVERLKIRRTKDD